MCTQLVSIKLAKRIELLVKLVDEVQVFDGLFRATVSYIGLWKQGLVKVDCEEFSFGCQLALSMWTWYVMISGVVL